MTPKKMGLKILSEKTTPLYLGKILYYSVRPLPFFKALWISEISSYQHGVRFSDRQLQGPYAAWHHEHEVIEIDSQHCTVIDRVFFKMPFGFLGGLVFRLIVQGALKETFSYRRKQLEICFPSDQKHPYSFILKQIKAI
jgi:ligand-binding SRPBCC domain-containing protein